MKKLAVLFVCVAMLASCDSFKGGSKDLKAENDSLLMELNQRNAELDDMMGTFNEVQEGFRKINAAESRVDLQRGTITENSASAKQQIASDIEFISKQMEENKAQIAKLQAQLKNSNYNSAQMKKAVAALTAELNAKQHVSKSFKQNWLPRISVFRNWMLLLAICLSQKKLWPQKTKRKLKPLLNRKRA